MFQRDLLEVLDDFKIQKAEDYYGLPPGERTYFIRRLYKAFSTNRDSAYRDLATAGGLKLHFASGGNLASGYGNVPSPTFLKKMCFYANRSLVTFPFKKFDRWTQSQTLRGTPAKAWKRSLKRKASPLVFGEIETVRTPIGAYVHFRSGHGYKVDPLAFADFLKTIGRLRAAIDAGLTYVMPVFPDQKVEQRRLSRRLTSANFSLKELQRQFVEEDLDKPGYRFQGDLLNLYLPYFTNIPFERVLELRHREADMYNSFQRYLEKMISGLSQSEGEHKILHVLRDVDMGIRELDASFNSIKVEYGRKNVFIGIGVLSTGLALVAGIEWGQEIAKFLASATGTATGMQFLSSIGDKRTAVARLSQNQFYVPWLIHQEAPQLIEAPS